MAPDPAASPPPAPDASLPAPGVWRTRWKRLRRHPVFPLLVFVVLAQIVRDNYPFSHYPMYCNPTSRPLPFQYLADRNQQPLPVVWHTGVTPSRVGKKFGYHKSQLIEEDIKQAKKENRDPRPESDFKPEAGHDVLVFLRKQSLLRKPHRHLPEDVLLMEVTLSFADDGFHENHKVVGRLR
ncbi:hypothetical protein [Verrucomicrobium sp. BvORR034]|jgi:hypothetical protein|uniref:hypothetical protein n=1 Tax=Verrucomicrobium sp. BvORR034 TaxID=1396418 RepID=UPI000678A2B8|nr:hypothetical protein [Verrucomicrobium sp. BvORR034]